MKRFGTFTNTRTNESGTAWVHRYEFELGTSPSNPIVFHKSLADLVIEQIRKRCAPAIQSVPGEHLLLLAPGHDAIAPLPEFRESVDRYGKRKGFRYVIWIDSLPGGCGTSLFLPEVAARYGIVFL